MRKQGEGEKGEEGGRDMEEFEEKRGEIRRTEDKTEGGGGVERRRRRKDAK